MKAAASNKILANPKIADDQLKIKQIISIAVYCIEEKQNHNMTTKQNNMKNCNIKTKENCNHKQLRKREENYKIKVRFSIQSNNKGKIRSVKITLTPILNTLRFEINNFKKEKMEIESEYDTPDFILGQLVILKHLGYSHRKAAELISSLGFQISYLSVSNHWKRHTEAQKQNQRSNCGRNKIISNHGVKKIVEAVKNNRFLTAVDIAKDKTLNKDAVDQRTIRRILEEEGLHAFKPQIVTEIAIPNRQKRLDFCASKKRWTKKWQRTLFTDESWMSLESNHLKFVRIYHSEQLSEEYSIKRTRFQGKLRIMIWAAISFDADEISTSDDLENMITNIFFNDDDIFRVIRNSYLSLSKRVSSVIENQGGPSEKEKAMQSENNRTRTYYNKTQSLTSYMKIKVAQLSHNSKVLGIKGWWSHKVGHTGQNIVGLHGHSSSLMACRTLLYQ
ncbi:hypothetical protein ABPG72_019967 [Tetrahymena utriculariae]